MQQARERIELDGTGRGFTDITPTLSQWVQSIGVQVGMLTVFVPHTSASLIIQENADPYVRGDLEAFFTKLVPDGDPSYRHSSEGGDDMPSHIRSALTLTQVSVPVDEGKLSLGTWQSVYFWEHRTRPRRRHLLLNLIGD